MGRGEGAVKEWERTSLWIVFIERDDSEKFWKDLYLTVGVTNPSLHLPH